jgi:cyclophilin family peptidyl-prolyl cis-trans isomerase/HEAT repeat protein
VALAIAALTSQPSTRLNPAESLPTIVAIEDARAPTSADLRVLLDALRGRQRTTAIRALGRLERRDVITDLLPMLALDSTSAVGVRTEAANALAQTLRGDPLEGVPHGQQEQAVLEALLAAGAAEAGSKLPIGLVDVARSIGRLPVIRPEQFKAIETFLRSVLERPFPQLNDAPHIGAARGLESLARLNRKIARLEEDTLVRLRTIARGLDPKQADHQRNALAALIAGQGVDADTLRAVLGNGDVEVRRLAMVSLTGSGSVVDAENRVYFIRRALSDRSFIVRLEAIRAWTRRGVPEHGCGPLLEALSDRDLHVVLAALDALGDQCRDDANVTDRVTAEIRTPPNIGPWQREAHALVALAKRAPDRAAIAIPGLAMHLNWQVRMYAARAAAFADDVPTLARLAADAHDNVAEAALPALRRRVGPESDAAFVAALNRRNKTARGEPARPYQVIRTAALALEGAESTSALVTALMGALERISEEQCETSRDVRLALIARLEQLGSEAQVSRMMPLLKDVDPVVAVAAAKVIAQWTGKMPEVEVSPRPIHVPSDVSRNASVLVEMESGKTFEIRFHAGQAPLAQARFLDLVEARYYNDLTFHRIAPNFVVQGGSPGAHEYCGACPFMRDEVGLAMNTRGSIGISTRGRDTGDSQIFINLVDNPRLDHEYTVFAYVCRDGTKDGMEVVDGFQEGERMSRLTIITPGRGCR